MDMFRRVCLAAAGLFGLVASTAAAQDKFPSRPITLLVPFTPGGPVDVQIRALAAGAERAFGVPVIVENKPGAGGTLAPATMAATAKPDGYTLADLQAGVFTIPAMQKVSFDPIRDFTYIIQLAGNRLLFVTRADAPWQSWNELVAAAKAAPNTITYGSSGIGGVSHLTVAAVSLAAGAPLRHIPYRGMSEVLAGLLGAHIQMGPPAVGTARPHIEAGTMRPLLSATPKRSAYYPDVPSLTDAGIKVDVDLSFPHGIGGPKGMAPEIVRILHDGFRKALDSPEHVKAMRDLDLEPGYLNSADYADFARKQAVSHRKLIEALGLAGAGGG